MRTSATGRSGSPSMSTCACSVPVTRSRTCATCSPTISSPTASGCWLRTSILRFVETLAERLAASIVAHPRVASVTVRVEKLEVGPGGVGRGDHARAANRSRRRCTSSIRSPRARATRKPAVEFAAPLTDRQAGRELRLLASSQGLAGGDRVLRRPVVLVPGGGPFADAVRRAQAAMGFGDTAAHHMALLAMEQYGCALTYGWRPFEARYGPRRISTVLRARDVPVWSPAAMALGAEDIPPSWEATSDSLAAWLAGRLGATRSARQACPRPVRLAALDGLVAQGVVDPLLHVSFGERGRSLHCSGPAGHATAAAAIRKGVPAGSRSTCVSGTPGRYNFSIMAKVKTPRWGWRSRDRDISSRNA